MALWVSGRSTYQFDLSVFDKQGMRPSILSPAPLKGSSGHQTQVATAALWSALLLLWSTIKLSPKNSFRLFHARGNIAAPYNDTKNVHTLRLILGSFNRLPAHSEGTLFILIEQIKKKQWCLCRMWVHHMYFLTIWVFCTCVSLTFWSLISKHPKAFFSTYKVPCNLMNVNMSCIIKCSSSEG